MAVLVIFVCMERFIAKLLDHWMSEREIVMKINLRDEKQPEDLNGSLAVC